MMNGAATGAVMWGIQQSVANRVVEGQGGTPGKSKRNWALDKNGNIIVSDEITHAPFYGDTKITSRAGPRTHPRTGLPDGHGGFDVVPLNVDGTTMTDAAVLSMTDGVVIDIRSASGFSDDPPFDNNVVIVATPKGNQITYGHMDRVMPGLQVGDTVHGGSIIGQVGDQGIGTGVHLHVEMRQGRIPFTGPYIKPRILKYKAPAYSAQEPLF